MTNILNINTISSGLAPMRGITNEMFYNIFHKFGEPDYYISEFLRVHATSTIPHDLISFLQNKTINSPIHIQLLGRDVDFLFNTAQQLQHYPIASINLNFGCPMPKISKKGVGGALLLELPLIDEILYSLSRLNIPISVKTRLGYYSSDEFPKILEHLAQHDLSAVYIHARTVKGLYSEPVDFTTLSLAKDILSCKIIANGDISSPEQAFQIAQMTHADGILIGRATISNPWIFRQINDIKSGNSPFIPTSQDYLEYVSYVIEYASSNDAPENIRSAWTKKYLVPLSKSLDTTDVLSDKIKHSTTLSSIVSSFETFFNNQYI